MRQKMIEIDWVREWSLGSGEDRCGLARIRSGSAGITPGSA